MKMLFSSSIRDLDSVWIKQFFKYFMRLWQENSHSVFPCDLAHWFSWFAWPLTSPHSATVSLGSCFLYGGHILGLGLTTYGQVFIQHLTSCFFLFVCLFAWLVLIYWQRNLTDGCYSFFSVEWRWLWNAVLHTSHGWSQWPPGKYLKHHLDIWLAMCIDYDCYH